MITIKNESREISPQNFSAGTTFKWKGDYWMVVENESKLRVISLPECILQNSHLSSFEGAIEVDCEMTFK